MPPARILIADDHTLMRQGLRHLCERMGGFCVVAEAANGAQAVELVRAARPDLILMDIVMPDMDGVAAIRRILRETATARIVALTIYRQEQYMLDAIRAGARGYLLKTVDAAELMAAIAGVHRGDYLIDPVIAARVLSELQSRDAESGHGPRLGPSLNRDFDVAPEPQQKTHQTLDREAGQFALLEC
jgi:DNA-binding NarL/FixJ family response regulator